MPQRPGPLLLDSSRSLSLKSLDPLGQSRDRLDEANGRCLAPSRSSYKRTSSFPWTSRKPSSSATLLDMSTQCLSPWDRMGSHKRAGTDIHSFRFASLSRHITHTASKARGRRMWRELVYNICAAKTRGRSSILWKVGELSGGKRALAGLGIRAGIAAQ